MTDVSTQAANPANPFQAPQTQPSGQPVEATTGQAGKEQVFTAADAVALRESILKDVQSRTDKAINSKVSTLQAQLQAAGIQLSAEQQAQLQASVPAQQQDTPAETSTPAPVASTTTTSDGIPAAQVDPSLLLAGDLMRRANVTVTVNDPEFATIAPHIAADGSIADPVGMLTAVQKAINSKAAREVAKGNPTSRVPLGGGLPAQMPNMSPMEKIQAALKAKPGSAAPQK